MDESIDNEVIIDRSSLSISAPMVVNELYDGILYSGFFGNLDSARMRAICDAMLGLAKDKEADFIIVSPLYGLLVVECKGGGISVKDNK